MDHLSFAAIRSFFRDFHRQESRNRTLRRAGVLIPIFEREGSLHAFFTERTEEVEHHKGQISFPGGVMDETDLSIRDTALRETFEEIGIPPAAVEIAGSFSDYETPSGFCITPIVGFIGPALSLTINASEVRRVFSVPLAFFLDSRNERKERMERAGIWRDVFFYRYGEFEIWGATAAMMRGFLRAVDKHEKEKKPL